MLESGIVDGMVLWTWELSLGGSPNVTGGCEKMGNWRCRSGKAILRECRAVGEKTVGVPEPGS